MKIVDLVAHVLSTPLEEPFAFSQGRVRRRSAVVVEVVTDEGVTGWGEASSTGLLSNDSFSCSLQREILRGCARYRISS